MAPEDADLEAAMQRLEAALARHRASGPAAPCGGCLERCTSCRRDRWGATSAAFLSADAQHPG